MDWCTITSFLVNLLRNKVISPNLMHHLITTIRFLRPHPLLENCLCRMEEWVWSRGKKNCCLEGSTESVLEERKALIHQTEEHPLWALVFAVEFSPCWLAPAAANELWPLKLLLLPFYLYTTGLPRPWAKLWLVMNLFLCVMQETKAFLLNGKLCSSNPNTIWHQQNTGKAILWHFCE